MLNGQIVADLHLHSKYSRAVSKQMVVEMMSCWGRKKGIDLLASADWLHPLWFRELKNELEETQEGIFISKKDPGGAKFLLTTEISCIYTQGGKGRRVHTLIFAPGFEEAEKINSEFVKRGCNLSSDGRPIVGLSSIDVVEIVLGVSEKCLIIPAHVWTPWFALYGSKSGFDSIGECFGKYADKIFAVETGLSSDPAMNWSIAELKKRAVLSFSDAHSLQKMGREATVFEARNSKHEIRNFSYGDVYGAIAERFLGENKGKLKISKTLEFYPEEGKYHYTGHRKCGVVQSPEETEKQGKVCHVCGKALTVGVMHRVDQLADKSRKLGKVKTKIDKRGVKWVYCADDLTRPAYAMLVPLVEILSEVEGVGTASKRVGAEYERLVEKFGSELKILLETKSEDLNRVGGGKLTEAIRKVRGQDIAVDPGFDGEFGKVKIWKGEEEKNSVGEQMGIF